MTSLVELRKQVRAAIRTDVRLARRLIRAYARLAQREKDALACAEARLFAAEADHVTGNLRRALQEYGRARRAFLRLRARRELLATDIGAVQVHAMLGNAAAVRRHALRLRRARPAPRQAAVVENALGSAFSALGDEHAAEECFSNSLKHLRRDRSDPAKLVRAIARQNLGIRLARRGAVAEALSHFDSSLAFFGERGMDRAVEVIRHNRGWAAGVAGQTARALDDLRAAREALEAGGDHRRAALARQDEAEILLRLGDTGAAAREAATAAGALDRNGFAVEAARARLVAARGDLARGRRGRARKVVRRAHSAFLAARDRAGLAQAAVLLGEKLAEAETTLRRAGHWMSALEALLARARDLPPRAGARLLRRRASAYPHVLRRWIKPDLLMLQAEGEDRSIPLLRRAFRAAEELRHLAPTGSLRAAVLDSQLRIYEALARELLERGRPRDRREAFLVLDAARARTLREEMDREAPGLASSQTVRALRDRLEALWKALERREDAEGHLRTAPLRLLREVTRCEREMLEALRREEVALPRGRLDEGLPECPCLAYAVVGSEVIGFLSDGDAIHSWSCGPLAALHRELHALRFQITRRLHGATDQAAAQSSLGRLAGGLLRGFDDGPLPPKLFAVIPPELGSLPVEALPLRGRPLLESTTITYSPTAAVHRSRWRRGGRALVVGIESTRLPAVTKELAFVRRRLEDAEVLQGVKAGRSEILGALGDRHLVHLAGHARARDDLPLLSALQVRDGWITASDLRGVRLREALVVLSACRTGDLSLRWLGEAMGGFPRALLAAGAAGIVASRWEVPDETALAWMQAFYRHLQEAPPDEAVAQAARALRRRFPHPADWSSFVLIRGGVL